MYSSFWTLLAASTKNKPDVVACFGTIMTQNFIFTFDYLFDAIKVTTKKLDMVKCTICINFYQVLKYFCIKYI